MRVVVAAGRRILHNEECHQTPWQATASEMEEILGRVPSEKVNFMKTLAIKKIQGHAIQKGMDLLNLLQMYDKSLLEWNSEELNGYKLDADEAERE